MQVLIVIIWGMLALGLLVFVHELGHFLVAKAAGIKVLKFSLGFGTKLFGFRMGETEYMISILPLGGYVKLAGENPDEKEISNVQPGDYFYRPWWIRLLVLLAGPVMNLIAAILILGTLYWVGFSVPLAAPQIVELAKDAPALAAGLQAGDVIVKLGEVRTDNWEKFAEQLNQQAKQTQGQAVMLHYQRSGESMQAQVQPTWDAEKKTFRLGITIAPAGTNIVERVFVGTPAEVGGFKSGDRLLAVEGKKVWTKYDFQNLVWPRPQLSTRFTVQRGSEVLELKATPIAQQIPHQGRVGIIGVNFKISDEEEVVKYPFFQAYGLGAERTMDISRMIFSSLGHMLTGKISAKDSLGGPITIMRMAGQEAKAGIKDFLFFISGISIMLAVLNLLPIPVLDGGSVVFFIVEGIRRKPLSQRIQGISQQIGFALLLALMVFATYNDIYKLIAPHLGVTP